MMIVETASQQMKTLDRQKLDVANKTRSDIFGWRGRFTPEFVRQSAEVFAEL